MRKLAAAVVVLSLIGVARAEDPKPDTPEAKKMAEDLMKEANAHYKDEDPTKAREAAEHALKLSPSDVTIMGFLGTLYEIKIGDEEAAIKHYDMAIRGLAGVTSNRHKAFKADLMARKANLIYATKDDLKGAIEMYQNSWDTYPLSDTAFKLSNLLHRLAGESTDPAKRGDWNAKAKKAAEDAYKLLSTAPYKGDAAKAYAAKVRTQLALCLEASGEKDAAAKALEGLAARDYDETCAYNQALLAAARGKGDEATELLKKFMHTRPTPKARNRLRRFIRLEPDFRELIKRPDWKELVEDEQVDEKKPG